jgi:hypothetical protein
MIAPIVVATIPAMAKTMSQKAITRLDALEAWAVMA